MLVEPRQDSPLEIDLMGTLSNAVTFAGIDYHFGFNAERFQRMVKLVRLSKGHVGIVLAMQNERRCSAILDEIEWRARFIQLASAQGRIAKSYFI